MSAHLLLKEVYTALTGLSDPPKDGNFWKPVVSSIPDLNGYNVIYSGDRIPDTMPDNAYPYILLEKGEVAKTERQYMKSATIYIDVGIKGGASALDEIDRVAEVIATWLGSTKFTNSAGIIPTNIQFAFSETGTKWLGIRYATITAQAFVIERW